MAEFPCPQCGRPSDADQEECGGCGFGFRLSYQYRLRAQVGQTLSGALFEAAREPLNERVMVVFCADDDRARRAAFVEGYREVSRLRHSSLARVLEVDGSHAGPAFAVLEWLGGGSLEARVRTGSTFDEPGALQLCRGLLGAAAQLQRGLPPKVHGAIRPASVYFRDGDSTPVLIGFERLRGAGREVNPWGALDHERTVAGVDVSAGAEPWTDQHAIGGVVLYAVRGQMPSPDAPVDLPGHLGQVVERLRTLDPETRFRSAAAALAELDELPIGQPPGLHAVMAGAPAAASHRPAPMPSPAPPAGVARPAPPPSPGPAPLATSVPFDPYEAENAKSPGSGVKGVGVLIAILIWLGVSTFIWLTESDAPDVHVPPEAMPQVPEVTDFDRERALLDRELDASSSRNPGAEPRAEVGAPQPGGDVGEAMGDPAWAARYTGKVIVSRGQAGVRKGDPCTVEVQAASGGYNCRVLVRCGGTRGLVYGSEVAGYNDCEIDDDGRAKASDPEDGDGDGAMSLDLETGVVKVEEHQSRQFGLAISVDLDSRVDLIEAAIPLDEGTAPPFLMRADARLSGHGWEQWSKRPGTVLGEDEGSEQAELPMKLGPSDLSRVINGIKDEAKACFDDEPLPPGTRVEVKIVIDGETGTVSSATVGGNEPTEAEVCAAAVFAGAAFGRFQAETQSFTYRIRL